MFPVLKRRSDESELSEACRNELGPWSTPAPVLRGSRHSLQGRPLTAAYFRSLLLIQLSLITLSYTAAISHDIVNVSCGTYRVGNAGCNRKYGTVK
jgi:hypothetical protein